MEIDGERQPRNPTVNCDPSCRNQTHRQDLHTGWVGRDYTIWLGVLGRHGISNCNDNGWSLFELCVEHSLTITNNLCQQKVRFKTTWKHPRSERWHLLDYIPVRQKDVDVLYIWVMPSANCYTDHRLVRATVRWADSQASSSSSQWNLN